MKTGCVAWFLLWAISIPAFANEVYVSEIHLSESGNVNAIIVNASRYNIVFNERGQIQSVKANVVTGSGRYFRLDHNGVSKSAAYSELKYKDGLITNIGDLRFEYNLHHQVERIGALEFLYESSTFRAAKIKKVGGIFFFWHDAHNQLSGLNDISISYDDAKDYITEITSNIIALGDWWQKFKVKIEIDINMNAFR